MTNQTTNRHLLVLSCSMRKVQAQDNLPAICLYDGPHYQILRSFLRESTWPSQLSVAVLSAKYGLIGGLAAIENYDQRMNSERAAELEAVSTDTLLQWGKQHSQISLVLGKDYLPAINMDRLRTHGIQPVVVEGGQGIKNQRVSTLIRTWGAQPKIAESQTLGRPLYFLPDWDDTVDVGFDFSTDTFSAVNKAKRSDQHCVQIMQPNKICDGVLVSLAQHLTTGGVLKKYSHTDISTLAPQPLRERFGLMEDQWLRAQHANTTPILAGVIVYINELSPSKSEVIELKQEIAQGRTDVVPSSGSADYYAIHTWNPPHPPPSLTTAFRLQRAIRIVVADPTSVAQAVTEIDDVVAQIELCALNENASGSIPGNWDPIGDEQDCDACDFRRFCPNPASTRSTGQPTPPPVAPG